jgi:hypothetical protein
VAAQDRELSVKRQFIDWVPRGATMEMVVKAEEICREWGRQGYDLTLRQLYYQFVSRDLIPNTFQSYKRLGGIVDQARLAGLLDWSYIVDRTRNVYGTDGMDTTPEDAIEATAGGYSLPRWKDQPCWVEVWVEKDALSGIVQRAAREVNVPYFACRGYVSQSEMYDSGQRFGRMVQRGREVHIYHLGDHDPSGIDMTRDIRERLTMFAGGRQVNVHRIALNMDQVQQYGPPPNYAKVTDSRFEAYKAIYGDDSWELDALDPTVLHDLIVNAVRGHIDTDAWNAVERREDRDRELLRSVSRHWDDIVDQYS